MNIEDLLKDIPKENHEHFISCLESFKEFYIKSLNELDFMKDVFHKNKLKISNIKFLPWHESAQKIFSLAHNLNYVFGNKTEKHLLQLKNLDHLQLFIANPDINTYPLQEPSIYLKPKIKLNGAFNAMLTIQLFSVWNEVLQFNMCFDHVYNLLSKPDQKLIYDIVLSRITATKPIKGINNPPEVFKELFLFL